MINYKDYPHNWKTEIRPAILARAGEVKDSEGNVIIEAKCEWCGLENHIKGLRGNDGIFYTVKQMIDKLENEGIDLFETVLRHKLSKDGKAKPITIVLTIAHLDHDKENHNVSYDRLAALCQRCHLNYDRNRHNEKIKANISKKKGLIELF